MDYIEVKNLKKYQPAYTDGRKLIWIRWDISSLSDYKILSLPVDGRWLFLCLICLGTELQNQVPLDTKWLQHISGINKTRIPKLVKMLQGLEMVVTKCNEMLQNVPTDIQTDIQTDREDSNHFSLFCKAVFKDWNALAEGYPNLPKIQSLSASRKQHLKTRFNEQAFREGWSAIVQAFRDSAWLRGDIVGRNGKPFKGGFDWIIANDTNYLKALEGKYKGETKEKVTPPEWR